MGGGGYSVIDLNINKGEKKVSLLNLCNSTALHISGSLFMVAVTLNDKSFWHTLLNVSGYQCAVS